MCGYNVFEITGFCKSWYVVGIGMFDLCVVFCEVLVKNLRMLLLNFVHRSLRWDGSCSILTKCGTLTYFCPQYLCGLVMEQQSLNHKRNDGKQV